MSIRFESKIGRLTLVFSSFECVYVCFDELARRVNFSSRTLDSATLLNGGLKSNSFGKVSLDSHFISELIHALINNISIKRSCFVKSTFLTSSCMYFFFFSKGNESCVIMDVAKNLRHYYFGLRMPVAVSSKIPIKTISRESPFKTKLPLGNDKQIMYLKMINERRGISGLVRFQGFFSCPWGQQ